MFDLKQLVEGLKSQGVADEEIVRQLEAIKADIDAYLNPQPNAQETQIQKPDANQEQKPADQNQEIDSEADENKRKEIFGI